MRILVAAVALSLPSVAFPQSADAEGADRAMGYRPSARGGAVVRQIADPASTGRLRAVAREVLPALPPRWDSRDYGWISPVKNQGSLGTCWAFASYATLEAQLLKRGRGEHDFSEKNMVNLHGWQDLGPNDGGNYEMAAAYLLRWGGAVAESNDVYVSSLTNWTPSPLLPPVVRVQNVVWTSPLDGSQERIDSMKRAIMEYGAVGTAIYWGSSYEKKNGSYYCPVRNPQNHAISFVGWDDDYSTNNFSEKPPGNGAWIIKNSWGRNYGVQGYYHVSYYDATIGRGVSGTVFIPAGDGEDYDVVRGHDMLGPVFDASAPNSVVLSEHDLQASVFTASWNERLDAIGVWSSVFPNPLEISVYTNVARGAATPVAGGTLATRQTNTLERAGFTTIPLGTPIPLVDGTGFAIVCHQIGTHLSNVVNCYTPGGCHPHQAGNSYFGYYREDGGIEGSAWFDGKTIVEEDAGHIDTNDVSWAATIKAYTRSIAPVRAGDAPGETDDGTAYLAELVETKATLFAETGETFGASAGLVGANGRTLWISWLAGFDPANPDGGDLTVSISITNGVPHIDWKPDLGDRRTYTLWGIDDLGGTNAWRAVDPADPGATGARFFKVSVSP